MLGTVSASWCVPLEARRPRMGREVLGGGSEPRLEAEALDVVGYPSEAPARAWSMAAPVASRANAHALESAVKVADTPFDVKIQGEPFGLRRWLHGTVVRYVSDIFCMSLLRLRGSVGIWDWTVS